MAHPIDTELLKGIANQLRIHSIRSTTKAQSGHPTSCCSAADLVAALFFGHMRYDPHIPQLINNDRFVLSKGHAAPLLYAAWAETGHIPQSALETLRKLGSALEGHPTPRLDFVDVATGSLGQGLSVGLGMAIHAAVSQLPYRTYVLLGDGEMSEGSVWEAISLAAVHKLSNLTAIVDVNRLGQSQETAFGYQLEVYRSRFEAFGWKTLLIDGHDIHAILNALSEAGKGEQPLGIVAKTIKGKGIPFLENQLNWHGKPLSEKQAEETIELLKPQARSGLDAKIPKPVELNVGKTTVLPSSSAQTTYTIGEKVSTRKAAGSALARIGDSIPDIFVLDGDVENSTYTDFFSSKFPSRFVECYISEQNMLGISSGLAARGRIPFSSTFASFYSRAMDQIRMAGISGSNIKMVGTHAGVSIGEDGPSQMGLEDLAAMRAIFGSTVLYPSDAVSTEKLVEKMAQIHGICYLRASRPETEVIYSNTDTFEIGGAKILRQPEHSQATLIGAGVTLFEALRAAAELKLRGIEVTVIDAYSIKPLARELILNCARKTNGLVITIEDHYPQGGLGDAVAGELSAEGVRVHKLAIYDLPESGRKDELMAKYKIDSKAIVEKVLEVCTQELSQAAG